MNKEEQIEEMAKVLCELIKDEVRKDCERCYFKHDGYKHTCKYRKCAIQIYDAGYGAVKQAVKEFAERVKASFYANSVLRTKGYKEERVCDLTVDEFNEEINELVKEVCGD